MLSMLSAPRRHHASIKTHSQAAAVNALLRSFIMGRSFLNVEVCVWEWHAGASWAARFGGAGGR